MKIDHEEGAHLFTNNMADWYQSNFTLHPKRSYIISVALTRGLDCSTGPKLRCIALSEKSRESHFSIYRKSLPCHPYYLHLAPALLFHFGRAGRMGPPDILPAPRLAPGYNEERDKRSKQMWCYVARHYHLNEDSTN